MKGPKIIFIAAVILGVLLLIELSNFDSNSNSWGQSNRPGAKSAEGPPEFVGVPAQSISSTLTHGAEADRPKSLETSAEELSRRDFTAFLSKLEGKLPTREAAAGLNAQEVHAQPRILLTAAKELGELADKLEKTPSLRPEALAFYKSCAQNAEILRSIRAVCFNRAQLLNADIHQQIWQYDQALIPSEVVELAKSL